MRMVLSSEVRPTHHLRALSVVWGKSLTRTVDMLVSTGRDSTSEEYKIGKGTN